MWFILILCISNAFKPFFSQNIDNIHYGPENPASLQLEQFRENTSVIANYTTSYGTPVDNPSSVLTVGPDGPMVTDPIFLNEFQHFNRENIPLRAVHAKGTGAWGTFRLFRDMSHYTRARILTEMERSTQVFARMSHAFNGIAVPDTRRNTRGFSIKFFTDDGNWDLLTVNVPVFVSRDPMKFISLAQAMKRNPVTNLFDSTMMWDYITSTPEMTNSLMYFFSDTGIPTSYREMDTFATNTFALTGGELGHHLCRFHLISNQGINNMDPEIASRLEGYDPDYYTRDLYNNIALGRFPSWNVSAQLMSMDESRNLTWNPFDATLVWPESDYPSQPFGLLELNANPGNFFIETEQSAFSPSRLVPGIESTAIDHILQGRIFAYPDSQMYRLGVNYEILPVNRPRVPLGNIRKRNGFARSDKNHAGSPNYYPNSYNGPRADPRGHVTPFYVPAGNVSRYNVQGDNFSQARVFWQGLSPREKRSFAVTVARALALADPRLHQRAIQMFGNVSSDLAAEISQALSSTGDDQSSGANR